MSRNKTVVDLSTGKVSTVEITGDELAALEAREAAEPSEAERKMAMVRKKRDKLLSETDYWALSDTTAITQAQTDYRQALRDITKTATSLDDVTWPTKPE